MKKKTPRTRRGLAPRRHVVTFDGSYPAQYIAEAWSYRHATTLDVYVRIIANGEQVALMSFRPSR